MLYKKLIRDYLKFSRQDRIGVMSLLVLILVIYFLPLLFSKDKETFPLEEDPLLSLAIDSLTKAEKEQQTELPAGAYRPASPGRTNGFVRKELFAFDPNTLPAEGWRRLGLPDRVIGTLIRYRSKGGRFRRKEDLRKIWALPGGFYEWAEDSLFIAPPPRENRQETYFPAFPASTRQPPHPVGINTSDSSAFVELPGIGSILASRITRFRDKLGGFYSVEQVGETFGLRDSVFQKIKPLLYLDGTIRQIHINTATKDELRAHPYFRWKLAQAVVEYRNQHGDFTSVEQLKNITLIDEATYSKMVHYVKL